jgi:hypothetical protein
MALPALASRIVARGRVMARSGPPQGINAPAWWSSLVLNAKGNALAIALNGEIALDQDPAFALAIRQDKFRNQTMVAAPLPWDPNTLIPRPSTNIDDFRAMIWLQGIMLKSMAVSEIVESIAARYAYHPVMDYFDSLGGLSRQTSI